MFRGLLPLLASYKAVKGREAFFSTTCMLVVETSQRNVYTAQVALELPGILVSSVTVHEGLTMPRLD